MPELPDVEVYRRRLQAHGLNKRIEAVHVHDDRLLEAVSASTLRRRLKSRRLEVTRRHGKLLFAAVSCGTRHLLMHFGMTGTLITYREDEEVPDHSAVILDLAGGDRLAFTSMRKLGHLSLVEDVDACIAERNLGIDALADDLDLERFRQLLAGRSGSIKGALMNQSLIAGIGNVYSDEMLLRAGVHPEHESGQLDPQASRHLHRAMRYVLDRAIGAGARPERMPRSFLLPERREGMPCPRCGGRVAKRRVAGRSAYFCPRCQKRDAGG